MTMFSSPGEADSKTPRDGAQPELNRDRALSYLDFVTETAEEMALKANTLRGEVLSERGSFPITIEHATYRDRPHIDRFVRALLTGEVNKAALTTPESEGYRNQGTRMWDYREKHAVVATELELAQKPGNSMVLVKSCRGGVLGMAALLDREDGRPAEVLDVFLEADLRGRDLGLGRWLIANMIEAGVERGDESIYLRSRRKGGFEAAVHLYERFGFQEVTGERGDFLAGDFKSPRTIVMELDLKQFRE
ncbi:MAG: GNAT family N-acetyltransferase [Bdellovibrionales bacterium]|nr:GNAT family N-acetyltransferase [Bdellovibrionales bacterium]